MGMVIQSVLVLLQRTLLPNTMNAFSTKRRNLWILVLLWTTSTVSSFALVPHQVRIAHPPSLLLQQQRRPPSYLHETALSYRNRHHHEEQVTSPPPPLVTTPPPTEEEKDVSLTTARVNVPLVARLAGSQVFLLGLTTILALVASSGDLSQALQWGPLTQSMDWPWLAVIGVVATFPMIALGQAIEGSARRDAHYINFSTTNMVVSLFGRRNKRTNNTTLNVVLWSTGLVLVTAVTEEVVFRGYVGSLLWQVSQHNLFVAWLGQAVLFGLGHVHPQSRPEENRLVAGLQFVHAALHGLVYVATGSLLPCILSHFLYDCHVLVSTWHGVNTQLDWTEEHSADTNQEQLASFADQLSLETRAFLTRFFYAFDSQHASSLSEEDVQRAVAYAFATDAATPDQAKVHNAMQNRERLELPEFVKLLLDLRAATTD
jgi:membrane protease YdiL (CAAX protease family)